MKRKKMGAILVHESIITSEQLDSALAEAKKQKSRLGETLIQMGLAKDDEICETLSRQLRIPRAGLASKKINQKTLDLIPASFCYKKHVIPLGIKDRCLWLAMGDPTDYETLKDTAFMTGYRTKPAIEKERTIIDFLLRYHTPPLEDHDPYISENDISSDMIQIVEDIDDQSDISFTNLEKAAKGGVIRQLTNGIIANAIKQRASDIHIEPQENEVTVRFRVDGIMRNVMTFTKTAHLSATSRIKIMANLDITIRRTPQDGRIKLRIEERFFDLRISSLPTYYGEKIVMRILDSSLTIPLQNIGMKKSELDQFKSLIKSPQGLVLITGPTGSGKTTTLYSALGYIFSPELNIVTIEDPVEYSLPGINQVQVNTATGMTFTKGLRSLLRQDPDVVMIGEIRDEETAAIAFQAAQTGHLVLSTLHTNDAVSAVTRLRNMGIEPFWIASSLLCVIAQRLTRKIHSACISENQVSEAILKRFPPSEPGVFRRGKGCSRCGNTGYAGRLGIYEMFVPDRKIKKMIIAKAGTTEILEAARELGMLSMTEDGFQKALQGLTTLEEVIRIAPPVEKPIIQKSDEPEPSKVTHLKKSQQKSLKDRIMVIDDDEAILKFVTRILTNEFYEVQAIASGKEGLNQVFVTPPDLILLDHEMPGMNGIDFIKKLKTHSRMHNIPVIMLTATKSDETEINALTVGADDWISKPIHKGRLVARIKRLLKK